MSSFADLFGLGEKEDNNGGENKARHGETRKLWWREFFQTQETGIYGFQMEDVSMDEDIAITPDQPKLIPIINVDNDDKHYDMATYSSFQPFDVVDDYSQHILVIKHTAQEPNYSQRGARLKEWEVFKKELPVTEGIFVRAYKTRFDLLTAVIVGAKGTPYQDGLFFFDLQIPDFYPAMPKLLPHVRYRSGGLQINPRIFKCGEVSLKLYIQAIDGSSTIREDMLVPGTTNILQLLVYIRDGILCANPLSNGSGCKSAAKVPEYHSLRYNEIIVIRSLKSMIRTMNNPPKNFENLVVGHFRSRVRGVLTACKSYMEGRFLEGKLEERCSMAFRSDVASCVKPLVEAFIKIGATEAQDFVSFSEQSQQTSPLLYRPDLHFHAIANDDRPLDVNKMRFKKTCQKGNLQTRRIKNNGHRMKRWRCLKQNMEEAAEYIAKKKQNMEEANAKKQELLDAQLQHQREKSARSDFKFINTPHDHITDPIMLAWVLGEKRSIAARHGWVFKE